MKKYLAILILITLACAPKTLADAASAKQLSDELDYWLGQQNAKGYLVWQFSGDAKYPLENDQYSFYQGSQMCTVLKQKATQYPDKFLGVNVHSLANHTTDIIDSNLSYLAKECGTKVVRIWGSPDRGGPEAVKKVLDSAQNYGLKVIVVIADYSNSSGDILPGDIRSNPTQWYTSGYKDRYLPYARGLAAFLKGHPALFGYELANEPHCSGIPACVGPYNLWARDMANVIKRADPSAKVGIGQKASQNTTLGDSPGPRQFYDSNNTPSLDLTSAHYYNASEKDLATQARSQAQELNKTFYIGEAGFVTNELAGGSQTIKKGPLEEGFSPANYIACGSTKDPEYHPLRPYPGSPCDPLIPRSIPEAPVDENKKYNTFACGTALAPEKQQVFDPYGDNSYYESLTVGPYAHTICDKRSPAEIAAGGLVTCYRTSQFTVTVDLSHANLGILGNTQDPNLTDEQKVNEYLAWYLTGTPQIGDQKPVSPSSKTDIDRLVNFSGPLRKLLPYDVSTALKLTVAEANGQNKVGQTVSTVEEVGSAIAGAAGKIFANDKAVVDALTLIVENGLGSTLIKGFDLLKADPTNILGAITLVSSKAGSAVGQMIIVLEAVPKYGIQNLQTALQAGQQVTQIVSNPSSGEVHNYIVGCASTNVADYSANIASAVSGAAGGVLKNDVEAVTDITQMIINGVSWDSALKIATKWGATVVQNFGVIWEAGQQAKKVSLIEIANCSTANLAKIRLDSYSQFNRGILRGLGPVGQIINDAVLQKLFVNVPFSSMEDTTGEVVLSVFTDPTNNQQAPNVQGSYSQGGRQTAPIQLIIESATKAVAQ